MSDALRRTEQLDRIGGVEYLTALLERVPTTSNVDYYAAIVDETSSRRRLMKAGSEVTSLAMKSDLPIEEVVDAAEARVFAVAERQVGDGLVAVGPMLQKTLERIEDLGSPVRNSPACRPVSVTSTRCWPVCNPPT